MISETDLDETFPESQFLRMGLPIYGQFMEQSGKRIPDAWYVKLTFSSIVTFYLTKTENR